MLSRSASIRCLAAAFVLAMLGGCASVRVPPEIEVTATIMQSEGPTTGSLVTLEFEPGSAMPPVGHAASLHTVPEAGTATFLGVPMELTLTYYAGDAEVVSTSENSAVVRITEQGGSVSIGDGEPEPTYFLPDPGEPVVVRWLEIGEVP